MKKMFSGFIFRLTKGYEIAALIALLVFFSVVVDLYLFEQQTFSETYSDEGVSYYSGEWGTVKIDHENYKDFRYENSGLTAYDLYRSDCEPVLKPANDNPLSYFYTDEMNFLCSSLGVFIIAPACLIVLFIPIFFGRMFSDGTIKNYISCGYSKRKIYTASLLFSIVLDLAMVFVSILIFAVFCLRYSWKPPIYLPVVITLFAASLLLLFTVTSVSLASLFISGKRIAPFIAGFLLTLIFIFTNIPTVLPVYMLIDDSELLKPQDSKEFTEYMEIAEKNRNEGKYIQPFEIRLDVTDFKAKMYYEGKDLDIFSESKMPPASRYAIMTSIYINPAMIYQLTFNYEDVYFAPYMLYHDGLAAINISCNILWITASNGIALAVFRKRETSA